MSRFSSVLFAVGFGLLASLTTLVSCGDTGNSIPASSKVDEAKDLPIIFMVGNMSGDAYKVYKEAQSKYFYFVARLLIPKFIYLNCIKSPTI